MFIIKVWSTQVRGICQEFVNAGFSKAKIRPNFVIEIKAHKNQEAKIRAIIEKKNLPVELQVRF